MTTQADEKEQLILQRNRERRFHRRSRKGCLECKKRHCDETTPQCLVCALALRKCSYPSHVRRGASPGALHQGEIVLTFQGDEVSGVDNHRRSPADCLTRVPLSGPIQINMMHLKLFHHFATSTFDAIWFRSPRVCIYKDITMKHAALNPVLAHQVLALSARHLSMLQKDAEKLYDRQAIELQCQAINLFNISSPQEMAEDWVSMFIFSQMLGVHVLCDVLNYSKIESNNDILDKFVTYCHLHRGVLQIAQGAWCELLESELGPLLRFEEDTFTPRGAGQTFEPLLHRLSLTQLQFRQKEACRNTLYHLQDIIDNRDALEDRGDSLLCWILLVPAEFVSLLEMRRQEALAILACYVGMLRHAEDVWLIGGSWRHLLHSIMACLDPEWAIVVQATVDLRTETNPWSERAWCEGTK
ncbi:hypothetical protein F5884DRAFT_850015 [Xylogone sp. PMI_703]|nr:hypothetical protein F5884DRAFT_850015 [Xylogone sp. PMI_703]